MLFLQGGSSFPDSKRMDDLFFQNIPVDKPMLYLPMAMTGGFTFDQCFSYINNLAKNYKFKKIEMWTSFDLKNGVDLKKYGSIYIGGGNTFKLLSEIKKNNFQKHLIEFLKRGGVICGGSAGAIIFGKEISTAADANFTNLKETYGLNLINNHSIWCHYSSSHDEEIKTYVKSFSIPVIALPEKSGVYLEKEELRCMGEEDVFIFNCDNNKYILKDNHVINDIFTSHNVL
jgi:dipeptidase E